MGSEDKIIDGMPANGPMADARGIKRLTKGILMGAGYRTAALVIFLLIAVFLFYRKPGIVPGIDTSFFFMPLAAGAMIFYIGTMAGLLLAGKLARPMMFAIFTFAVTVFLSLSFLLERQWPDLIGLSLPVFIVGTMIAVNELLKAYDELIGMVSQAGILAALLAAYFIYARPYVIALAPIWLVVVEWFIMCCAIAVIFSRARMYMKTVSEARRFGDGHAVTGTLHFHKEDIERTAAIIEEFVKSGKKESLIACVTTTLVENGSSAEEIERTLRPVIDHRDKKEPWLLLKWFTGDIKEANRRNRLKVATDVIDAAVITVKGQSFTKQNVEAAAGVIV